MNYFLKIIYRKQKLRGLFFLKKIVFFIYLQKKKKNNKNKITTKKIKIKELLAI